MSKKTPLLPYESVSGIQGPYFIHARLIDESWLQSDCSKSPYLLLWSAFLAVPAWQGGALAPGSFRRKAHINQNFGFLTDIPMTYACICPNIYYIYIYMFHPLYIYIYIYDSIYYISDLSIFYTNIINHV